MATNWTADDHMAVLESENFVSKRESDWIAWINRVEAILGHTSDGDQKTDGYSADGFYSLWESGISPTAATKKISSLVF